MMKAIAAVLVIDDDAATRQVLSRLLGALGAEQVCHAASAEEALSLTAAQTFNLIVADYRLEGADGVQFIESLRARGDLTPALLISGDPDVQCLLRASQLARVSFFKKPFRVVELRDAMQRLAA